MNTGVQISARDKHVLRGLAARYSELAALEVQKKRLERYAATTSLQVVRPVVLIDEVPWDEIRDEALKNVCDPALHGIEGSLRTALYQWEHFQVDRVIPPVWRVHPRIGSTGIGIHVQDTQIKGDTGAYISSHAYVDQLQTEEDLAKLTLPELSYNHEATDAALARAHEVFDGLMPVELGGVLPSCNIWDDIARYRGVDSLLLDLADRPDFMHRTARRFMEIAQARFLQYEALGVLDTRPTLIHCTVAHTRELPAKDYAGHARLKDVWGRCSAQILGSVSPEMHDEFDLVYNETLFGGCGLLYYGCCEPLHAKIGLLRKRFKNLRKISITPWADPDQAADNIGRDYVMAAKPNPAFVAQATFDPRPVEREIERYCVACRRNGTPLEFVLKDISTIANNPGTLAQWAATVNRVIDRHYG
jgi:hypothetical protein